MFAYSVLLVRISKVFHYLNSVLENLGEEQTIVTGDTTIQYVETMSSFGFVNEINIPTYVSPISGEEKSCLDYICHNFCSKFNSSVVRPAISDHFAVIFFDITVSSKSMRINFRDFSCRNIENFENNVQDLFDNCNLPQVYANECAKYIDTFLLKALNKHFPIKSKLVTAKRLISPWLTTDINQMY